VSPLKWVLVLEGFPDKPEATLPTSRRIVVSFDGPEKALKLMTDIVKGEVDPHGNEWEHPIRNAP
jgi:hypothetical protein